MNIQIMAEHEQFIQAQIERCEFTSAEDVINEAFKLLEEREKRLEELRPYNCNFPPNTDAPLRCSIINIQTSIISA